MFASKEQWLPISNKFPLGREIGNHQGNSKGETYVDKLRLIILCLWNIPMHPLNKHYILIDEIFLTLEILHVLFYLHLTYPAINSIMHVDWVFLYKYL